VQVFSQLVPKGSGSLTLITDADEEEDADDGGEDEEGHTSDADDATEGDSDDDAADEESAAGGAARSKKGGKKGTGKGGRKSSKGGRKGSSTSAAGAASSSAAAVRALRDRVDSYRGLSAHVSFTGGGAVQPIAALSGGQKTLVALALIFAIQRVDPAPFYLFDETDSALDPVYRASVASVIQKRAHDPENPAQFLVTTFRPEIATVGDRFFRIAASHQTTTATEETKEEAIEFIVANEAVMEAARELTLALAAGCTHAMFGARARHHLLHHDRHLLGVFRLQSQAQPAADMMKMTAQALQVAVPELHRARAALRGRWVTAHQLAERAPRHHHRCGHVHLLARASLRAAAGGRRLWALLARQPPSVCEQAQQGQWAGSLRHGQVAGVTVTTTATRTGLHERPQRVYDEMLVCMLPTCGLLIS